MSTDVDDRGSPRRYALRQTDIDRPVTLRGNMFCQHHLHLRQPSRQPVAAFFVRYCIHRVLAGKVFLRRARPTISHTSPHYPSTKQPPNVNELHVVIEGSMRRHSSFLIRSPLENTTLHFSLLRTCRHEVDRRRPGLAYRCGELMYPSPTLH
jgi:hypothetical protein